MSWCVKFDASLAAPRLLCLACLTAASVISAAPALADDEYGALFVQTLRHPKDSLAAYAFVRASEERHDYEAAIGTLERLLFFESDSPQLQARLGMLYYQLKSYDLASDYIGKAIANPKLDEPTRGDLTALLAQATKAQSSSHFTGFLQTGLRYQSNASYNPDSNLLRIGGQDYASVHPQSRGADGNAFALSQVQHNLDFGNQRGDSLETLFSSYYARQFRLPELSVGFVDGSVGPRLAIDTPFSAGWTWKPYLAAGQVWLGGARYVASFGGGVTADLSFAGKYGVQPGVEVRRNLFNDVSAFSSLATSTSVSPYLGGNVTLTEKITGLIKISYSRGTAANAYQTYSAINEDIGLVGIFAAPIPQITVKWSVSPYLRFTQTIFDGANPFIDPFHAESDKELTAGITFDTPLATTFGFATTVQFSKVASNIPNFATRNLSVLSGPVLRF